MKTRNFNTRSAVIIFLIAASNVSVQSEELKTVNNVDSQVEATNNVSSIKRPDLFTTKNSSVFTSVNVSGIKPRKIRFSQPYSFNPLRSSEIISKAMKHEHNVTCHIHESIDIVQGEVEEIEEYDQFPIVNSYTNLRIDFQRQRQDEWNRLVRPRYSKHDGFSFIN